MARKSKRPKVQQAIKEFMKHGGNRTEAYKKSFEILFRDPTKGKNK